MKTEFINEILDKLKKGEISEYVVKREDLLSIRENLVNRQDFKHFRGIAKRGGDVLYQYIKTPRS